MKKKKEKKKGFSDVADIRRRMNDKAMHHIYNLGLRLAIFEVRVFFSFFFFFFFFYFYSVACVT